MVSLCALLFVTLVPAAVLCCSPTEPVSRVSASETFKQASIVILGTYESDYHGEPVGDSPPFTDKHVIVDVNCTVKSPVAIGEKVTLNGNIMWNSCFHSELIQNKTYLIAADRIDTDLEGFIRVHEVNVASVGTYEPNYDNLGAAYYFCADSVTGAAPKCACDYDIAPSAANRNMYIGSLLLSIILLVIAINI